MHTLNIINNHLYNILILLYPSYLTHLCRHRLHTLLLCNRFIPGIPPLFTASIIDFIGATCDMGNILQLLSIGMNICERHCFIEKTIAIPELCIPERDKSSQTVTNTKNYELTSRDINNVCDCCGLSTTIPILILIIDAIYVLKRPFESFVYLAIILCVIQNGVDLKTESLCIYNITNHRFDITQIIMCIYCIKNMINCIKTIEIMFTIIL